MIKRISLISIVSLLFALPAAVSAQTVSASVAVTSSNSPLLSLYQELVSLLEQELQALLAAKGGASSATSLGGSVTVAGGSAASSSTSASSGTSLTADPDSGAAPLSVAFSGNGVKPGSQYIIDYGDGSNSGPLNEIDICMHLADGSGGCPRVHATHSYTAPGTYTATLEGYIACMWASPIRCMIAAMPLGTASITVSGTSTAPSAASSSAPTIGGIQPSSGPVGTEVTLTGDNFAPTGNIVQFGAGAIANLSSTKAIYFCPMIPAGSTGGCAGEGQDQITFTVPSSVGPYCPPGAMCPMYLQSVQPGSYDVSVQNDKGTSAVTSFTVTSS